MYSDAIERALEVCLCAHSGQFRRGSPETPYSIHPISLALLACQLGESEVVVQAALLHDVVEDCDDWEPDRIESEFGSEVAGIVAELTEDKSKTWEQRKQAGIDKVAAYSQQAVRVKSLDKLHNLSRLADQLEAAPDVASVWAMFRGGRDRTLAMSRALVEQLAGRARPEVAEALRGALARVEAAA